MHGVLRGTGLAACLLLCGCSYVKNRVNDLLDPFRVDVGVGPGLYAETRVTDFFATGLGFRAMATVGLHGRSTFVDSNARDAALLLVLWGTDGIGKGAPILGSEAPSSPWRDLAMQQMFFFPTQTNGTYSPSRRGVHVADVHVGAALLLVGADVGFSPGEFLDLLLGFVGIDIAGDDVAGLEPPAAKEPEPPKSGAK